MTTNINIRISDTRTQTVRKRVSIPHTDLWTQDWWDAQVNPSAAVRRLIHDDVARNGIEDLSNRLNIPVQAAPVPVAPPVDPRDAEINALREEVAKFRDLIAPLMPFFSVVAEDKKV